MKKLFGAALFALWLPCVILCITDYSGILGTIVSLAAPLFLYSFLLSCFKHTGRGVWSLFLFLFLAAFQIVLLYLFGRSIIAVDMFLNLVTTNAGEAGELLGSIWPSVVYIVIIYIPLLTFATIYWKRELPFLWRRRIRSISLKGLIISVVGVAILSLAGSYRVIDSLFPANVGYNMFLAVERTCKTARYAETSKSYTFNAKPTHPADSSEVYVLVVGETARAANFSLYGYERETNPLLAQTEGLTVFQNAFSQSNTTHKSVPMLLSAVSPADFENIYNVKSVITAFKEAGFYTVFFSNQRPNHSFIDFFGYEADETLFVKEHYKGNPDSLSDEDLLPIVEKTLAKPYKKQLIVLHTYGQHFNYRERYPRERAFFLPDDKTSAKAVNRPTLLNAYDNSLRETDRFLYKVIELLDRKGSLSALLFCSDHGENIYDDYRKRFLHAAPVPTWYELRVPLLLWMSGSYRASFPALAVAASLNAAKPAQTGESVFYTLLQLGGLQTPILKADKSLVSATYACGPRLYLTDRNIALPFSDIGMDKIDLQKIE